MVKKLLSPGVLVAVVVSVLKYHVIDGRRCEVKKALTKSEMNSIKSATGAGDGSMNAGDMGSAMMPYSMAGWQSGGWLSDESSAAATTAATYGPYGSIMPGAPGTGQNANNPAAAANFPMTFGSVAGMIGSMLAASMGAQGMNMAGGVPPGPVPPVGYPAQNQNAGTMPGQSNAGQRDALPFFALIFFHFICDCVP